MYFLPYYFSNKQEKIFFWIYMYISRIEFIYFLKTKQIELIIYLSLYVSFYCYLKLFFLSLSLFISLIFCRDILKYLSNVSSSLNDLLNHNLMPDFNRSLISVSRLIDPFFCERVFMWFSGLYILISYFNRCKKWFFFHYTPLYLFLFFSF